MTHVSGRLGRLAIAALLIAGCSPSDDQAGGAARKRIEVTRTAPVADLTGQHGGEHEHPTVNGGLVVTTSGGQHMELKATPPEGSFELWLLKDDLSPRPLEGQTATLRLTVPGYGEVVLHPAGDRFVGHAAPFDPGSAAAVAIVRGDAGSETARFPLQLASPTGAQATVN